MVLLAGSTTMTDWTVVGDGLAWIESPNPWSLSAQDGNRFLDLTILTAGAPFGGVTQTIATDVGSDHLLSFYLGSLTAIWGGPPVSILATAGSASQTCTDNTTSTVSTWTLCTVPFTALLANTPITLLGSAGFNYIGLDNVSVTLVGWDQTASERGKQPRTRQPPPPPLPRASIDRAPRDQPLRGFSPKRGDGRSSPFSKRRPTPSRDGVTICAVLRSMVLAGFNGFATGCRNSAAERATGLGATDENPNKSPRRHRQAPASANCVSLRRRALYLVGSGITFPGELL